MTITQPKTTSTELAEAEPSVGELVTSAFDDISTLVRHEIDLAKAELTVSVKNGGLAAGLFGAAAFLLFTDGGPSTVWKISKDAGYAPASQGHAVSKESECEARSFGG